MTTRRSMLKMLGIAPAAAIAQAAPSLAGLEGIATNKHPFDEFSSLGPEIPFTSETNPAEPEIIEIAGIKVGKGQISQKIMSELFKRHTEKGEPLPPALLKAVRNDARHVSSLDPDLAEARSFSLSAKFRMQQERRVKASIETAATEFDDWLENQIFRKLHGVQLW